MAEVEVDDTTVADTRLPASTFASTMRTMVISPTQQSSHCIFLINEREREKGGGRERGGGDFQPHSGSCAATPRTCSYPERDRQSKREKEREREDWLPSFLLCRRVRDLSAPGFPCNFFIFSCDFYTVFIVAFLLPLEWTVFLPASFPCQHGNCCVQEEEFKKRCDFFCGSKS